MARLQVSVQTVGQNGLNWPRWRRLLEGSERLGFDGIFCSDHFMPAQPPDLDSIDALVALAYAAATTTRLHFGTLVAPLTFRHPAMLARQAANVDDLSGGRMVVGVGAGWMEREHTAFGFPLGDTKTRLARFEEGLTVLRLLLHGDGPADFEGRFFQLRAAELRPRPTRTPIMVGGNGMLRTLPLAARYADRWNGIWLGPEGFKERSTRLDELLRAEGRDPASVPRSLDLACYFGRDAAEVERKLAPVRTDELADLSTHDLLGRLYVERGAVGGDAARVAEQLRGLADVGVAEVMLQWTDLDDLVGLRAFAEEVLPRL